MAKEKGKAAALPIIQLFDINDIVPNPGNPRVIKDAAYYELVKSMQDFPEMVEIRPVVVNKEMMIIGGNQRYRAAKEAGWKTVAGIMATNLTERQEKEFMIKDNLSAGDWEEEVLKENWNVDDLEDWGLKLWTPEDVNLEDFFETDTAPAAGREGKHLIVLDFDNVVTYEKVKAELNKREGTKEQIICNLLGI